MDKLRDYLKSLSTADQYAFARRCNTTLAYLRKAISIGQMLGFELALLIEKESNGAVSLNCLRADLGRTLDKVGYVRISDDVQ